jgi:hypothetical protein
MDLLFERRDLGRYGLGRERSLADFAKFSGVDYAQKLLVRPYHMAPYFI